MAVNDFITINTQVTTATHAARLKSAIDTLRRAIDELQFFRKTMEHMTNETDFALIEEKFGIETGKGGTVYTLVNTSVSAGARNLTEQVG